MEKSKAHRLRMPRLVLTYHNKFYRLGYRYIAGVDEAGRGPLAGPVVCAAVILKEGYTHPLINDSKQLSDAQRRKLFPIILADALAVSYVFISPEDIDRLNIYQASKLGMLKAIEGLSHPCDFVITDAMKIPELKVPHEALIQGDAKALPVAAASIIAKVLRDDYMIALDQQYPDYRFKKHKGYPTPEHLMLLEKLGPIAGIYRNSFAPVQKFHRPSPSRMK